MEYLTILELQELLDKSEIEYDCIDPYDFTEGLYGRKKTLGGFAATISRDAYVLVYCEMEKEGVELRISFNEHRYHIVRTEGYTKRKVFNLIIKELKYLKDKIDKYLIEVEAGNKEKAKKEQEFQEKMKKLTADGKIVFSKYNGYNIEEENDG